MIPQMSFVLVNIWPTLQVVEEEFFEGDEIW